MAKLEHATLDVLTRVCGGKAITIVATGNRYGLEEYVDSTIWCIQDFNQSEPATVRSVYGGPLEYVSMELSEQALDGESEGEVLGDITLRYMEEADSNKVIIIMNPWGNTLLPGMIKKYSNLHNRYVHQIYIDYYELRNAILMGESSGADYKVLDKFRSEWSKIRERGDSFAEVWRDPPVSDNRVREYTVDLNLDHLVSTSTRVREAIRLQDASQVVKLYPSLRNLLLKKQKILDVWVGSSAGIVEELESLEAAQLEVWEFWGSRETNSPIIPELLQSANQANSLVQNLQSAEEDAKSKVALVRERVLPRDPGISAQEAIDTAEDALHLVRIMATSIVTFTESTSTDLKKREAPDSGRHIGETWSEIEDPEKWGHVITSDVKHHVDLTINKALKQAERALAYVKAESQTLQLFRNRKR
ncbi:hypothetical protein MK805_07300 [Shimazuella sp. AN120528]|uniref:hypothetical protein n=1 Tax=Shimazuella soli TaxID=1892854 RepID=UPI001F0DF3E9|nr:hypothetical protein [Shimazuella soli]MCH5584777.1 hypothetical protein [Shimazuella soli]